MFGFRLTCSRFSFLCQGEEEQSDKPDDLKGKRKLQQWLNKSMKIEMTDGRTLIGE